MAATTRDLKQTKKIEAFNHEGHHEGTTTNDYVSALDLDARGMRSKTIILKNTHATYELNYKLLVSAMYSHGEQAEEVAETELGAGETAKFRYTGAYGRMILQVESATDGEHATYTADYTMSGI